MCKTAIVIVHPEMGIYLGNFWGMGFWTLLDCAGQPSAVAFPSLLDAITHVLSWEQNNDPEKYAFVGVTVAKDGFAWPENLQAAGLGDVLGDMVANALREALEKMPADEMHTA